ncbi:MAG: exosortase/archaeosortase family protein [Candidatus Bathyarchaeia archaeon]
MLRKILSWQEALPLGLGIKAAALILVAMLLYIQDLTIIFNDAFQSETTSHLLAIPILFAYLIYRKRKMLRAVAPIESTNMPKSVRHVPLTCGIILSTTAILLYWYGSYTFTPIEHHMLTLPIFVAGLTLILFNHQTLRHLAFPIAFLAFLVPPPSEILYAAGSTLSVISSEASNAVVKALGVPSAVTSEYGNPTIMITRPDGTQLNFTVDIACSGIYSLLGFLIFAVFIAYIIRDKPWKKLILLCLGAPLIYLLNIVRITIILLIGYHYGEQLALQVFHLLGGWILMFLGTLLLLAISEKIFKMKIFTHRSDKCPHSNKQKLSDEIFCLNCGKILKPKSIQIRKVDVVKIAVIAVSIILLAHVQAPVFAIVRTKPVIVTNTSSEQQVSTEILPQISGYNLYFWYRDTQFEAKAKQDMSLIYLYKPLSEADCPIWVTIEISSTRSSLHRWETCLVTWPLSRGYQPKVDQIELKDIQLTRNPPIISRYFVFQYRSTKLTQAVLYWYENAWFKINMTAQQKYVKISLITYPETLEELPEIESQMVAAAKEIVNYWQPVKLWSQLTMIIAQNGLQLSTINGIILTAIAGVYIFENNKQKKLNANAYQKLPKIHQQIVNSITEAEKNGLKPTLGNVSATFKEITGNQLLERFIEIEKVGIIKRGIAKENDEPILIWKAQF